MAKKAVKLRALITGGTGFLGTHVEAALLEADAFKSTFLSRKPSADPTRKRVLGDLTSWDAGLKLEDLKGQFDVCLHMAGLYDLRVAREDATVHNIGGTHTALTIAQKCEIPLFVHISTVAVTIPCRTTGFAEPALGISPDSLLTGPFPDFYSQTKSAGEKMVREWTSDFPKRKLILRPGILVGPSDGRAIHRIDGPYHAIDSFRRLRPYLEKWRGPLALPGHSSSRVPLVPVDVAARAIVALTQIINEQTDGPPIESFYVADSEGPRIDVLYKSALRSLGLEHKVELLENAPAALIKPLAEIIARLPREELEYVLNLPRLDTSRTTDLLGPGFFPAFETYEKQLWGGYHAFIQNR